MSVSVRLSAPSYQRAFSSGGVSETASEIDRVLLENRPIDSEETRIAELDAGAEAPLPETTVNSCLYYLRAIFSRAIKLGSWSSPHITLSESNEIVFEWWNGTKKITLYFGEHDPEYIKVWGTDIETEMESGILTDGWTLTSVWLWLHS
jgi:hypothetical protein